MKIKAILKRACFFLITTMFTVSVLAFSGMPLTANGAGAEPLTAVSVELAKNADSGNHHLIIRFNKRISTSDGYPQVDDAKVRANILINGKSVYEYQSTEGIMTIAYYNTNGNDAIRVNIPTGKFSEVFASDNMTGEIVDTEIEILQGLEVESGEVLGKDTVFTYFALGDIILNPGDSIGNHTTNIVSVQYHIAKKHLRIYFDTEVGTHGGSVGEPLNHPAREKIVINGKTVQEKNLELYMDPASISHNTEGDWYEYIDGEKVMGGANGYITCRYMMRVSLDSSSGTYDLKLDGSDVVEFLPGLKTKNDKIVTTTSLYKLPKENVGVTGEATNFFVKAKKIVEPDFVLARGTGDQAELAIIPRTAHSPIDTVRSFTFAEMNTYFAKLKFNGESFAQITGLTARSEKISATDERYQLIFTFPKDYVKFDGQDSFAIEGGFVYPNGNDAKLIAKTFVNNPINAELSYENNGTKTVISVRFTGDLGSRKGEFSKITLTGHTITDRSVTQEGNVMKIAVDGVLADGDALTFCDGMLDGSGNAVGEEMAFVYRSDTKLMHSNKLSGTLIVDKINVLKNQDNGVNTWVFIKFRNDIAEYSSYPTTLGGDIVNMYRNIKINDRPVTDALTVTENPGLSVIWLGPSELRMNIPTGNVLVDFSKPLKFEIGTEFRTNLNYGLQSAYRITLERYSDRDNMWIEKFNEDGGMSDSNHDLKATGVSGFADEGQNVSLALTFNQKIASGFFPHANATADFMSGVLKQYYNENDIKFIVYNGLGDSLRDNIILDGKSLWERMIAEEGLEMNTEIMAHYGSVGMSTLQIFIGKNSQSADFIDTGKTHTLTIKKGFKVPNGGILDEDITFQYNVASNTWSAENNDVEEEVPVESGQNSYGESGCGASIAAFGKIDAWKTGIACAVIFAALWIFGRNVRKTTKRNAKFK